MYKVFMKYTTFLMKYSPSKNYFSKKVLLDVHYTH